MRKTKIPPDPLAALLEIPKFLEATPKRMAAIAALPPPKYQIAAIRNSGSKLQMRNHQEVKKERQAVAQAAAPDVQGAIDAGAHTMEALRAALPNMDEAAITLAIGLLKARKRTAPLAAKAKAEAPARKAGATIKGSKTLLIKDLLLRPNGCTSKDVLAATGWPSVSMPAQAKAAGLKLRQEKEKGKPTVYYGSI